MKSEDTFILTLSCPDRLGIVSKISTFLADHQGFILELAQFGDTQTGRFFLRSVFSYKENPLTIEQFTLCFRPIAQELKLEWSLHSPQKKTRTLILVSSLSHCLNDLLHRVSNQSLGLDVVAVGSNHENLRSLTENAQIPFHYWPILDQDKQSQEQKIASFVEDEQIELVILARYMQILSPDLTQKLKGKAINIHHSFLPSFKGAKPYHQAYEKGVKLIGATAHYVSDELDEGPIIEQEVLRVNHTFSAEKLVEVGKDIEQVVLARAIQLHIERRVFLNGRKTVIF